MLVIIQVLVRAHPSSLLQLLQMAISKTLVSLVMRILITPGLSLEEEQVQVMIFMQELQEIKVHHWALLY